jgi:NMD protein affecting ribosome stability and mRNA decay
MDKGLYGRKDRLMKEREHDVYRSRTKLPDPTLCPECGAVFMKGRWVWSASPKGANQSVCPACRRIADRLPVGLIEMRGVFFGEHRDEIINLVQNVEEKEKANHPMERIMAIEEQPNHTTLVTTTGIHVARGIGSALFSAYNGKVSTQYLDSEHCVKVCWAR